MAPTNRSARQKVTIDLCASSDEDEISEFQLEGIPGIPAEPRNIVEPNCHRGQGTPEEDEITEFPLKGIPGIPGLPNSRLQGVPVEPNWQLQGTPPVAPNWLLQGIPVVPNWHLQGIPVVPNWHLQGIPVAAPNWPLQETPPVAPDYQLQAAPVEPDCRVQDIPDEVFVQVKTESVSSNSEKTQERKRPAITEQRHPGENIKVGNGLTKKARLALADETGIVKDGSDGDGDSSDCILLEQNLRSVKQECPRYLAVVYIDDGRDNAEVTENIAEALHTLCDSVSKVPNSTIRLNTCCTLPATSGSSGLSSLRHVRQNDQYSCGYRNAQMMLSALAPWLPLNHPYYDIRGAINGFFNIPSLRQLQETLEAAWRSGLDPGGAQHYLYKIVGKTVWIGAVEVWSMLSYWKVDSAIVQFVKCPESRRLVLPFVAAYFSPHSPCLLCSPNRPTAHSFAEEVLRRAERTSSNQPSAFSPSTRSCSCPLLPLYLQWSGHSITVVGVENDTKGNIVNLIALDPKQNGAALRDAWSNPKTNVKSKPGRLPPSTVRNKDIQIIVASPGIVTSQNPTAERMTVTASELAVQRAVLAEQSQESWVA